ncbi:hypothetical protein BD410DRAFT_713183 [Rickenella mellea]|uniref:SPIN90/Ldb17 leucine-rich domain-containing protein n=1 Tax=Rickenella mellea TaxID=50990 RepID=A0A4Y7QKB3_9AGAM|nr:hypothetical protein BD410DRAFT_713183 [Rickenella mellea]
MDVFGIVYIIENAQQFWSELEDILQVPPNVTLTQLDSSLKRFVSFCATYHEQYLQTPIQFQHACNLLLESELFAFHSERMCDRLLEDAENTTDPHTQLVLYKILLLYGRSHPSFIRSHKKWQPVIPLLMDHVLVDFDPEVEDSYAGSVSSSGWSRAVVIPIEAQLRLLAVGILYEVCRVQKFSMQDLVPFDDAFIEHLFELVEQTRHMQDETLNYSVIKLIVALNEQFMVASLKPTSSPSPHNHHHHGHGHSDEDQNRVLIVLMRRLGSSKTFGENMIFMLNRANRTPEDLCMQLLVLKILYLLFTTKGTSEYFYTNDLCVLVDVFLRELVDLDEESESLRHTYLRVLHPLLTRTQLRTLQYKRAQIVQMLESLTSNSSIRDISPTTRRLVDRCLGAEWCAQFRNTDRPGVRVSSPSSSSTTSDFRLPPSPDDPPPLASTSALKVKGKLFKASKSVENLSLAAPVPKSPGASQTHAHRQHARTQAADHIRRPDSTDSAMSLASIAGALPAACVSSSSLPLTSPSHPSHPSHPVVPQRRRATASSSHSAPAGLMKPAPPPKRRKPPAVPVGRTARGATITTIASSSSAPSPLSRALS